MNREIKFRGKIKEHFGVLQKGIWIYGGITFDTDRVWIDMPYYGEILVDKETVGQFTGLHDKNGKEIYEGDVVKIHKHSYEYGFKKDEIGQIKFLDGVFGFYREKNENEYYFNDLALEYYEVIGNIYDNPELLGGE